MRSHRERRGPRTGAWVIGLIAFALSACEPVAQPEPSVLRVSAIPDQSPERVWRQHGKLVELVCAGAAVRCEWTPVKSYEEVVARVGSGEIDLAYFGGVAFAQAYRRHGVVPVAMRDIDMRFTSVVVVRQEMAVRHIDELRGRSFAFGDRSSSSGHIMARRMLREAGVEPERHFASVVFSGGHDATLRMVASGEVEAGAVNASIAYRAIAAGDAQFRGLKVIWQSPPYTDHVWAVRSGLPQGLRQRLLDAFLDLDMSTPERKTALEQSGAGGFVPAYASDFDKIASTLEQEGRR
ncbi:MAG: putative selenate ABC transporter substrate-binding protein [Leptothrix sp. (in: Bacteria)]|nr:putative selenate ABC transporter substrate-binding protein [Leptothrix sp. (in: b-proteobacteria)]